MCSYYKSNSMCEYKKNVVENKLKSKWLFLRIEIISLVVFLEFNVFFFDWNECFQNKRNKFI